MVSLWPRVMEDKKKKSGVLQSAIWKAAFDWVSLMVMDRVKQFLLIDGIIVAVGILFFLWTFLRRKSDSHFREDLWRDIKDPAKREKAKIAYEDKVDKKILLSHRPDAQEASEKGEAGRNNFKLPNFRGKPHEILGIPADASAEIISKAHKFWMKRYHPDRVTHLGDSYVEQARLRAEQLNTARQAMLQGWERGRK